MKEDLWEYHTSVLTSKDIIYIFGFTEDPNSKYMVVMDYANKGNLRENLTRIVKNIWNQKLYMLYEIISGLSKIHEENLIHCDFHDGNILNHNDENKDKIYISDLGLCQPVKSVLKKYDIYGVIPFMAPEVLRGKSYTQASDIYSFSMIILSICKGERPEIIESTPQCYVDLMKRCWNEDPLKRPPASEVKEVIENWIICPYGNEINEELKRNIMEFINAPIGHNNFVTKSHPQACYTSRLLDFTSKKLNEILDSEGSQASVSEDSNDSRSLDENTSKKLNKILESEDLNDCVVRDLGSLDENISKKLNEILESKGLQASVSKDLNDYIIKDLESLDEN
ncbi:unnamed protein product [Rhizophagus irregularis]|nr:unnamed protein product [Rhizophagus irregularis]